MAPLALLIFPILPPSARIQPEIVSWLVISPITEPCPTTRTFPLIVPWLWIKVVLIVSSETASLDLSCILLESSVPLALTIPFSPIKISFISLLFWEVICPLMVPSLVMILILPVLLTASIVAPLPLPNATMVSLLVL